MASWVITISKDFKEHWDYAKRDGVWDMPKNFRVKAGDAVYFRFSGGHLIGRGEATSDARPLSAQDPIPWTDGRDPYTTRFTWELVSDAPLASPIWGVVGARLSKSPPLQGPRPWDDPADEEVFASYFEPTQLERTLAQVLQDEIDPEELDLKALSEDQRRVVEKMVAVREGQRRFRQALIDAYGQCAVTGTEVEAVLEAAHIAPYRGRKAHDLRNGVLLRRDIHRLFDNHLLTIDRHYVVHTSPSLDGSVYADLDGAEISLPQGQPHPDPGVLAEHNKACKEWYVESSGSPSS